MIKEIYDLTLEDKKSHVKLYGDYNDTPPNLTPVEDDEFWTEFMHFTPQMVEHRYNSKEGSTYKLYHFSGGKGYAIKMSNNRGQSPSFYKFFLCEHKDREHKLLGNCWHQYTCTACGYKWQVDSSG